MSGKGSYRGDCEYACGARLWNSLQNRARKSDLGNGGCFMRSMDPMHDVRECERC